MVIQDPPQGTGDAGRLALEAINKDSDNDIVVFLYADTILVSDDDIQRQIDACSDGIALSVQGFESANPSGYGRLKVNGDRLDAIIEAKDASDEELQINLCNSGIMVARLDILAQYIPQITNQNQSGEYILKLQQ